jgi:hypothetical protein
LSVHSVGAVVMENNVEAQNVYWRTPKAVHETEEAVNSLYAVEHVPSRVDFG